MKVILETCRSH